MRQIALVAVSATFFIGSAIGADALDSKASWPDTVSMAKDAGVDYPATVRRARHGDRKALATLFALSPRMDGSGADSHASVLRLLLQSLGDRSFSHALSKQSQKHRQRVIHDLDYDFRHPWRKQFPLTYALGSHDQKLLHESADT
ncbi:hypothetical protein AYO41_00595 [Verrucomicrobia bacterium SCGC AG-212-E04]|nr:hypothetical protein AYO41_00595 [Verrucomicrobia bacterium SCGC AG-212-E04]